MTVLRKIILVKDTPIIASNDPKLHYILPSLSINFLVTRVLLYLLLMCPQKLCETAVSDTNVQALYQKIILPSR